MADYENPTSGPDTEVEDEDAYWSTDDEVMEAIAERRKDANKTQQKWRDKATETYKFVAGEQWDETDQAKAQADRKPLVTFNRVGPIVNAVCGQQICNRQETRFLPREAGDMQKAEIWSQVVSWAREQCDAEDEESDAFRDLVITGMGWTCTNVVYDEDPAGMIKEQRTDPRRMRWDPSSRKKNLADARWVQCDYWYSKDEIEEKWPDIEDFNVDPKAMFAVEQSGMPHDATNAWRYQENSSGYDEMDGKYRCIHELHWRLEEVYQVPDVNGEVTQLTEAEWEQLQSRLKELGIPVPEAAETMSRKYYEAWTVGSTVLQKGEYPMKSGFEYQAMTGLRDEDGAWYGLARPLMDPQRFANKTFTQIIGILNSNAKGGIIAESSAVTNQKKFEEEWSKSDGVSWVEDGAVSNSRIQSKPPPQIPAELTKLLEYSVGGMREVTGVNVEFLGQTDKVQPGVVEAMRTKAGLVILAPWFDAMRLYMKRQGRLLGEFINTYIADGRWIRISGLDNVPPPEPQPQQPMQPGMMPQGMPPQMQGMMGQGAMPQGGPQGGPQGIPMQQGAQGMAYIQLVKQPDVMKYDIIVDESAQSRDVRERHFQALMQIVPMAMQIGMPIPSEIIDFAPLPETLRAKWKEKLQKAERAPKEPPLALQIENMRGENMKAIEGMKQQAKQQSDQANAMLKQQQSQMDAQIQQQQIVMQAEAERVVQAAQAESQRMVDQSKLHMDMTTSAVKAKQDEQKMLLDAKLTLFETILNATLEANKNAAENQMTGMTKIAEQQAKSIGNVNASQENSDIITVLLDALNAPKEAIRDKQGNLVAAKRKMKPLGSGASQAARVIWDQLSMPHTAVRGSDGRITGSIPASH